MNISGQYKNTEDSFGTHPSEFMKYVELDKDVTKNATKRKNDYDCQEGPSQKQPKFLEFTESKSKYNNDSKIQQNFDEAMLEFMAMTFSPFYVANNKYFRKLIQISNPRITAKDRTTYARKIGEKAASVRLRINRIINSPKIGAISRAYTTDLWTSMAQDAFISLTCHFIDMNFVLHRWTPFCKPFAGRHTGETIEAKLSNTKEGLKDDENILIEHCVNDKASNVVLAVENCPNCHCYRCNCHTLQLANISRIIFAIPASSAKSERVFSDAGNTVRSHRTRLDPDSVHVQDLVIVAANLEILNDFEEKYDI
jgi:hypothetical protein